MKKILAIVLAMVMVFSFAACGGNSSTPSSSATPASSAAGDSSAPAASTPAEGGIQSVDDLTGKTIGVQLGTTGDIYAEDIEGATIERYNKGFEAVQALQQGKIDAVMIDDQVAKAFAEQTDGIKVLEEPFTIEEYAICISKDKPELTESFNKAIAELKEDGTLQKILDYYIGQVEGAEPYSSPEGITYDGQLVMATNAEFPPYEYHESGTDGDKIVGVDADFARAICDKLGKELVIEDMAFDSIITAVQGGKADFGAAGMTVTEDRLKNIDFTDSYCTASQVVIVKE